MKISQFLTVSFKGVLLVYIVLCTSSLIVKPANIAATPRDKLVTYDVPEYLTRSDVYQVVVNGRSIPVQKDGTRSYVHFSFAGTANITIKVSENVNSYTLSPKSYNITSTKNGISINFSLTTPRKLILWKVNSLSEKLFILADPLEDDSPKLGDSGVKSIMDYGVNNTGETDSSSKIQQAINEASSQKGIVYFPAGVYKIDSQIDIKSNTTIYLAGGAYIRAGIRKGAMVSFNGVSNARLIGRGVMDANRTSGNIIKMRQVSNIILDGIVLQRSSGNFHVYMIFGDRITISNIKLVGETGHAGNDGIDPDSIQYLTIDDVFVYSGDDCHSLGINQDISQNLEYLNMTNSVLWNNASGAGMKSFGFNGHFWIRYITYENFDIVHSPSGLDPLAIGGGTVDQIWFKNIRVEDLATNRNGSPFYVGAVNYNPWGSKDPSIMSNLYFQNITMDTFGGRTSLFEGRDSSHLLKNVTFDHLYIAGTLRMNIKDANFQIGNQYVHNLIFVDNDKPVVSVTAPVMYTSKRGKNGVFRVSRTGNTKDALTLNYYIHGTAANGKDYRSLPGSVSIPAGKSSADIVVAPKADKMAEGPETVMISLKNKQLSSDYMIGPDWRAVVVISD